MITLYGIPNCDTVKKTMKWLTSQGIAYEFHNYKKMGLPPEKVDEWLQQVPFQKLVNKAGTTFRKLSDEQKAAANQLEGAKELMLQQHSVIKRPIIEKDNQLILIGFNEDEYNAAKF